MFHPETICEESSLQRSISYQKVPQRKRSITWHSFDEMEHLKLQRQTLRDGDLGISHRGNTWVELGEYGIREVPEAERKQSEENRRREMSKLFVSSCTNIALERL